MTSVDLVTISEPDARSVLATAMAALGWAKNWREQAQTEGPTQGAAGERWDWYRNGSDAAARHDAHCVEEELRKVLGLPPREDDT